MALPPEKRLCSGPHSPLPFDYLLEALLSPPHSDSTHVSRALPNILLRHRSDTDKLRLLEHAVALGLQLQDVGLELFRNRASLHNSVTWPLTHDLTIKVFSLLGVQSICQAAISCRLFHKVAMEPACYKEVDLTGQGSQVNDKTVAQIIKRAGRHLRSLRLGSPPRKKNAFASAQTVFPGNCLGKSNMVDAAKSALAKWSMNDKLIHRQRSYALSEGCLDPLIANNGAVGAMLETLHLFNISGLDSFNLRTAIAACPCLTDLVLVGLCINSKAVLKTVAMYCHGLKRLCFQKLKSMDWPQYGVRTLTCTQIVEGCPNISSLALRGFRLPDQKAEILLKGLHHLKEADFSEADLLTGLFLRDLICSGQHLLQSLILRDCVQLREVEVKQFLSCLSSGECKSLKFLDVSNKNGLAPLESSDQRVSMCKTALSCACKDRPGLKIIANFPEMRSFDDIDDSWTSSTTSDSSFGDLLSSSSSSGHSSQQNDNNDTSTSSSNGDSSDSSDEDNE